MTIDERRIKMILTDNGMAMGIYRNERNVGKRERERPKRNNKKKRKHDIRLCLGSSPTTSTRSADMDIEGSGLIMSMVILRNERASLLDLSMSLVLGCDPNKRRVDITCRCS